MSRRLRPASRVVGLTVLLSGLLSGSVVGQQASWEAGVRPRTEARSAGEVDVFFTSMRTQVGLRAALSTDLRLFVQVQDARFWGGTRNFDQSADALDLFRGYFELGHRGESVLWTRVGRQTLDYANGRLVGDPEWSQFGRSFDGVRTTVRIGEGTLLDGFGMQLRESFVAGDRGEATLWGIWGAHAFPGGRSLQLFWIRDQDAGEPDTARNTFGLYHDGSLGPLVLRVEGAWQTGQAQELELRDAYLIAGALTLPLPQRRGQLAVGYDRYSGAANPEEGSTQAFSDLFGRNHRFLGFADIFFDVPRNTGGQGLQDFRVQLRWGVPWEGLVGLAVHHFRVADAGALDSGRLADEVDLTLNWPGLMDGTFGVLGGVSWAGLGGAGKALNIAPGDIFFGYLMVEAAVF